MNRTPVASSRIASMGWENNETMEVEFSTGAVYQYSNVSKELYDKVVSTDSVGQAFNMLIKNNSEIPYKKL